LAELKEELHRTKENKDYAGNNKSAPAAIGENDKSRIITKITRISTQLEQNDLSYKVEQYLKRIHESINT
jgi:hypothetical protein